MSIASDWIRQAAAIPLQAGQLCLVTSSSGKRWVIPKGVLEPGKSAGEIALQEAWEEAGLVGRLLPEPVGSYLYKKWGRTCHVTVFLMHVTDAADEWPERALRQRCWLPPTEALARLDEAGLREVICGVLADGTRLNGAAKPRTRSAR
jgi:8-oxo-dGTP pyrophosphatase MutT (NUDIX family)